MDASAKVMVIVYQHLVVLLQILAFRHLILLELIAPSLLTVLLEYANLLHVNLLVITKELAIIRMDVNVKLMETVSQHPAI